MKRFYVMLDRVRGAWRVLCHGPVNTSHIEQTGYTRGYEKGFERGRDTMYREIAQQARATVPR